MKYVYKQNVLHRLSGSSKLSLLEDESVYVWGSRGRPLKGEKKTFKKRNDWMNEDWR